MIFLHTHTYFIGCQNNYKNTFFMEFFFFHMISKFMMYLPDTSMLSMFFEMINICLRSQTEHAGYYFWLWHFQYCIPILYFFFRWRVSVMFTNLYVSQRLWYPWLFPTISGQVWRQNSNATSTRKTRCRCLTLMRGRLILPNKLPPTWVLSPTPKATCTDATNIFPCSLSQFTPRCTYCTCPPHPLVYKARFFLFY